MNEVLKQIGDYGIVPVVKIDDANDAVPLAKALIKGGLPVAEVTFRTDAAEEAIRLISENCPEMFIGAGTVLTCEQVDKAVNAGAKFIVSPGLNPKVVKYCVEKDIPVTPGCANPSDIEQAIELGLDVVKFFPAEAAGGLNMIKAMSAPYGNIKFMPTGGISAKNLNEYLNFSKILACGGSWMVKGELINEKKFDEITKLTKEAVHTMLGFDLKHVGINTKSKEDGIAVATAFDSIFGFETKTGESSAFAGKPIEAMYMMGAGTNGHLAISTNSVPRAYSYLKRMGVEFLEETKKYDDKGNLKFVYLKDEIGGFAVHLITK